MELGTPKLGKAGTLEVETIRTPESDEGKDGTLELKLGITGGTLLTPGVPRFKDNNEYRSSG